MITCRRTVFRFTIIFPAMATIFFTGCAERPVDSGTVNGITREEAEVFLEKIKESVNSAVALSKIVRYPMYLYEEGKDERVIHNEADFTEVFPSIIDVSLVDSVKRFDPRELWYNSYGYMICNGQIWFAKIDLPEIATPKPFVTVIQPAAVKVRLTFFRREL